MILDIEQRFDYEPHGSYITRKTYIDDHLMVSSFVVWMMMKQSRHLKKFIQGFVVLTNLVPSLIFESNEWVVIGPLWSKIAWITQKNAQLVNFMRISSINFLNPCILLSLHGHLMLGD